MKWLLVIAPLSFAFLVMGWQAHAWLRPPADQPAPDTVRVPYPVPLEVAIPPSPATPHSVAIYQRDTVRVTGQCMDVPDMLVENRFVLSAPEPLTITSSEVRFPSYDPGNGVWSVARYQVPKRRWEFRLDVGLSRTFSAAPQWHGLMAARIRYRRLTLHLGALGDPQGIHPSASLTYQLF